MSKNKQVKMEIDSDGNKCWYNERGQLHREDGPAIEYTNGNKRWYKKGRQYYSDGMVIDSGGNKFWFNDHGQLHRIDGPSIEYADGTKIWKLNDKNHRIDGPAVEYPDGSKFWYINGEYYTKEEFNKKISFPDFQTPYSIKKNGIYFIKFKKNIGLRVHDFAEAYVDEKYIRLSENLNRILLQFAKSLENNDHVAPLLDWIQENSIYFPDEFIEKLFY